MQHGRAGSQFRSRTSVGRIGNKLASNHSDHDTRHDHLNVTGPEGAAPHAGSGAIAPADLAGTGG